jgi:glutathione S-transferase
MKLYSIALSPFAARVRLAIYRKGLAQIDIVTPPQSGTKGAEFLSINPMGQVPTLELDDGRTIPESATILEYLEDVFPTPSLRPADPYDLARARLFLRLPDLHFQGAPRVIIGMRRAGNADQTALDTAIGHLRTGLAYMDHFLDGPRWAVGAGASLADCAIIPVLNVVTRIGEITSVPDLIARHPKLQAYWSAVQNDAINAKVIAEQNDMFRTMMARTA